MWASTCSTQVLNHTEGEQLLQVLADCQLKTCSPEFSAETKIPVRTQFFFEHANPEKWHTKGSSKSGCCPMLPHHLWNKWETFSCKYNQRFHADTSKLTLTSQGPILQEYEVTSSIGIISLQWGQVKATEQNKRLWVERRRWFNRDGGFLTETPLLSRIQWMGMLVLLLCSLRNHSHTIGLLFLLPQWFWQYGLTNWQVYQQHFTQGTSSK